MNQLFLIILIIEALLIYNFNGKNAVSPSFISCCGFIISAFVLVLSDEYFKYELSLQTILIVVTMLLCILIGEKAGNHINTSFYPRRQENSDGEIENGDSSPFLLKGYIIFFLFLFVSISGALYLLDSYRYSLTIGNTPGNIFGTAEYIRFYGSYSPNILLNQANVLSECIIYFCFYSFAYNIIYCHKKNISYLLPVSGFIFYVLANDGRSVIIKYLCVCCIIYFGLYKQKSNWLRGNNKKIFKVAITAVVSFLIIFRILGYRTGTSVNNSLWNNLAEYISSGLVGLDKFITDGQAKNMLFGQNTFKAIYATLRDWGLPIPNYDSNDIYFSFAEGRSNIYTGLKSYIKDFSLVGAYASMFLWGYFITKIKMRIRINGVSLLNTYMFGLCFYPVVMLSIAGATHVVLCMPTIYSLIYLKLLETVFMKRETVFAQSSKTTSYQNKKVVRQ